MIQQSRQHEYPKIPELSKTTLNPVVAAGGIEVATIGVAAGDDIEVVVLVVAVGVPLPLAVPAESRSAREQAGDPGRTPAAAAVVNRNGAEEERGAAAGVEVVVHRKPWEDCNGGSRSVLESQAASRWLGTDMGSLDRLL